MRYYDHFVIPFTVGVIALFCVIGYKYVRWITKLPSRDKKLIRRNILSAKTLGAAGEIISESLLHRNIFRVNPLLGYMHMSLAFGWFLLIIVGWIEASMHLPGRFVPLYAHVFFKYFAPTGDYRTSAHVMGFIMDALLLFVLTGVALAWFKRVRSRVMGMRRTTKHVLGDRIALAALWLIFPLRLLAESAASGMKGTNTFLTGNIGNWMIDTFGTGFVYNLSGVSWWLYSIVLGVFFISLPFSRYMHIFTEVPLIFLRRYGVRSDERFKTFDHFQVEACSRCGICIDPCQLQAEAGISGVQSVYYLRDRRYHRLEKDVADNCLMCGRCTEKCPVGIDLNTLRLNSRTKFSNVPANERYNYVTNIATPPGEGSTGFFAGCMTHLSPNILRSMEQIFAAAGEQVWWADREGGICCGRPLKLTGEIEASWQLMQSNRELFRSQGITTLITPCPICLKVFREDYNLKHIEVLHHSQYIERLIMAGRISLQMSGTNLGYHDPCELARGSNVYEEPRSILSRIGILTEIRDNRKNGLCCGGSLANTEISEGQQNSISEGVTAKFEEKGAETISTGCPLCKKTLARTSSLPVKDISELVARAIK